MALSIATAAVGEPSTGTRMCLNMVAPRVEGPQNNASARAAAALAMPSLYPLLHETIHAPGQDQGVARPLRLERLDRRRFMDHPRIVEQQHRPGLGQREALAAGAVGLEHARLAALDPGASDQEHRHVIDPVTMRALGCRAAD